MTTVSEMGYAPWSRGAWHGEFKSNDGTEAGDFEAGKVAEVLAYHQSADDWDGTYAAIVKLDDGRFVSWEGSWGPTGSGFSEDAYGGDTDVWFSSSLEAAIGAVSEQAMEDLIEQVLATQPHAVQAAYRLGGVAAAKAIWNAHE